MFGKIAIYSAGVFLIISIIAYALSKVGLKSNSAGNNGNSPSSLAYIDLPLKIGRFAYYGAFLSIVSASLYLLYNILQHNFQFTYIYEYSSKELFDNFLVATFYAGQEGSFMLWTLLLSVIGFLLIPYTFTRKYENTTMAVYSSVLIFLVIILIFKSPFDYVWESFPDQDIPVGFTPENGRGLNPVLQNYWITIHPPILFIGYSLLTVPYVMAVAAFIRRDYRSWIRSSLPWILVASAFLGFGLMLGGFWAYETLGWGGFWAWDPVENSSLIPWLVSIALLHTVLISMKTGGLLRTNFLLATFSFVMVLYATFLTRSGVLGDTSVHSFVSPGPVVYQLLLIMLISFTVFAIGLIIFRIRNTPSQNIFKNALSKESGLISATVLLLLLAFLVSLGTSWPIIQELTGQEKSMVDIAIYNQLGIPLAIAMLLGSGLFIFSSWRKGDIFSAKKVEIITGVVIGLVSVVAGYFGGIESGLYLITLFAVVFAIVLNKSYILKTFSKSLPMTGSAMAHIGVALLILGAMLSGGYMVTEQVSLRHNQPKEVFGQYVSYSKREKVELFWEDRDKYKYSLAIGESEDNLKDTINPIFYWSDFNDRQSPFMEPGIQRSLSQDLYFSPKGLIPSYQDDKITLMKGQSDYISIDSSFRLQLLAFDMSEAMQNPKSTEMLMGTVVRVSNLEKGLVIEDTLYSELDIKRNLTSPFWYQLPEDDLEIGFMQLVPNKDDLAKSEAVFAFKRPSEGNPEILVFDVSKKPFINLVWAGTIIMVLGLFVSVFRYTKPVVGSRKLKENISSPDMEPEKTIAE
ncbi:MAG: cytochrome c biogenesis protein CcsA [Candidatus Kapaibacteriales bacterium]